MDGRVLHELLALLQVFRWTGPPREVDFMAHEKFILLFREGATDVLSQPRFGVAGHLSAGNR